MTSPKISVAMSVYNNARFLAEAIESILAQTAGDFEFLIVNDGSSDGSGDIIDSFAERDSRVRAFHQENRGLIFSLNRLLDEARAPLIARMDGDDIALSQRFERQLAFLESHPDHGVVGTWTVSVDEHGRERVPAPGATPNPDHPTSHEGFLAALKTGPLLCHSSVMMRADIVRSIGGYHAAFHHCEDYDLWLRLSERTRLCSLPERLLLYRCSESQVSSVHILAQKIGAAIAFQAHCERAAGRPDPTEGFERLPPLEDVDRLFGRKGLREQICAQVAPEIIHSPVALRSAGYDLLLEYVRRGGSHEGLWRTVARLVKLGEPARALGLASALAR
jgi:glycosyltransferase involved in cell wall biosynthesis